jgi:hypothetical protein
MKEEVKPETEKCILCEEQTNVPINQNIENRSFYVEGAGQLCESCYNKIYGPRMTKP